MSPDLSLEGLRARLAELTEEEPDAIGPDVNLFELGLESIALMQLVSGWRRAGVEVNFAELAERPTLAGWAELLGGRVPASEPEDREPADETGDEFPLAVLQHAYWVGRGPGQRLGGVAAHLYVEFDGTGVDPDRLRTAVERLVARHPMLRVVVTDNGRQRIAAESGWRGLGVHDLRDRADATAELESVRERYSHQMLDIESGEVLATALSLLPGGRTRLHVDVDMVAADAVSYRLLLADLAALYADPAGELPALGCGFAEYRAARPAARREAAERDARWWADRLAALPGAPELPTVEVPGADSTRVARRAVHLPAEERAALGAAARAHGLTVAMVVATAFAEVVGAWSARERFLLNVPLFDRDPVHPDIDHVVGDFTSSVLLDIDLSRPATFAQRAAAVQARMHADAAHAAYTGVEVLRDLTRRAGRQVLAPVVFTSAIGLGELFSAGVREHFGDPVWIISQGPQVLLDAQVTEVGGGLLVNWDARGAEFAPGVVDAMFAAFAGLVRRLAHDRSAWQQPVDVLPDEQRAARERANATGGPVSRGHARLHDGFFARAARTPQAVAVAGPRPLTYGELAERAPRPAAARAQIGRAHV